MSAPREIVADRSLCAADAIGHSPIGEMLLGLQSNLAVPALAEVPSHARENASDHFRIHLGVNVEPAAVRSGSGNVGHVYECGSKAYPDEQDCRARSIGDRALHPETDRGRFSERVDGLQRRILRDAEGSLRVPRNRTQCDPLPRLVSIGR